MVKKISLFSFDLLFYTTVSYKPSTVRVSCKENSAYSVKFRKTNLASAVDERQHQQIKYHDKKGVNIRELRVNQPVLVRNHRVSMQKWIP